MTEVTDVFSDLMSFIREEAGIEIAPEQQKRILARFNRHFGGEKIYVAKLPKLERQERIQAAQSEKKQVREVAESAGISERHARRLLRGK
jgi:hypothetical protein